MPTLDEYRRMYSVPREPAATSDEPWKLVTAVNCPYCGAMATSASELGPDGFELVHPYKCPDCLAYQGAPLDPNFDEEEQKTGWFKGRYSLGRHVDMAIIDDLIPTTPRAITSDPGPFEGIHKSYVGPGVYVKEIEAGGAGITPDKFDYMVRELYAKPIAAKLAMSRRVEAHDAREFGTEVVCPPMKPFTITIPADSDILKFLEEAKKTK